MLINLQKCSTKRRTPNVRTYSSMNGGNMNKVGHTLVEVVCPMGATWSAGGRAAPIEILEDVAGQGDGDHQRHAAPERAYRAVN